MLKRRETRRQRFLQVMELAQQIACIDPHGLSALVRLIASALQARAITSAAYREAHKARSPHTLGTLLFDEALAITVNGHRLCDLVRQQTNVQYQVHLGRDAMLAVPWHRGRLANALASIGFGRSQGTWKQDTNHQVTLVLPFGVALVHGGNHSLSAGIANGEGCLLTSYVQDISPVYDHVDYNGTAFIRRHDGHVLLDAEDEEPGILFEIGRLMLEHGVSYDVMPISSRELSEKSADRNSYYKVLIDGEDAGVALTDSGAEHALLAAGIDRGSPRWNDILRGNSSFTRRSYEGRDEEVYLHWTLRRRIVDDLSTVHGVMPWVESDVD